MPIAAQDREVENDRILLHILESVERDGLQSQRSRAAELGIALGLVNSYLKRCVRKGLLKAAAAPTRRYAYYITPQGFAEKSRLTVEYLSHSFHFFRRAKADCATVFADAAARGFSRVAIAGVSDLAEIATICAVESGVRIVRVVDPRSASGAFLGYPIVGSFSGLRDEVDAIIVTDMSDARDAMIRALEHFDANRVLVPSVLGLRKALQQRAAE